jgi:hypothetical protein
VNWPRKKFADSILTRNILKTINRPAAFNKLIFLLLILALISYFLGVIPSVYVNVVDLEINWYG